MLRFLAWVLGIVGVVALALYAFVFDVWTVPGDDPLLAASIAPTLSPGDVVVVWRRPGLDHGYLARCPDPEAPGRFVVARAIAKGGETVSFDAEIVSVDGHHTPSAQRCEPADVVVHDPTSNSDLSLACEVEEYGEMDFSVLRSFVSPKSSPPKHTVEPRQWFLVSDDRHVHLDSRDYGEVDPHVCEHVLFRVAQSGRPSLGVLW
jgi:signal peptidase I